MTSASAQIATRPPRPLARLRPATGLALVGAAEERERRPEQDLQVDGSGAMLHVPDVELDALGPGQLGAAVDLGPAGDPGLDVEPPPLVVVVPLDLVAERRARPDDRH